MLFCVHHINAVATGIVCVLAMACIGIELSLLVGAIWYRNLPCMRIRKPMDAARQCITAIIWQVLTLLSAGILPEEYRASGPAACRILVLLTHTIGTTGFAVATITVFQSYVEAQQLSYDTDNIVTRVKTLFPRLSVWVSATLIMVWSIVTDLHGFDTLECPQTREVTCALRTPFRTALVLCVVISFSCLIGVIILAMRAHPVLQPCKTSTAAMAIGAVLLLAMVATVLVLQLSSPQHGEGSMVFNYMVAMGTLIVGASFCVGTIGNVVWQSWRGDHTTTDMMALLWLTSTLWTKRPPNPFAVPAGVQVNIRRNAASQVPALQATASTSGAVVTASGQVVLAYADRRQMPSTTASRHNRADVGHAQPRQRGGSTRSARNRSAALPAPGSSQDTTTSLEAQTTQMDTIYMDDSQRDDGSTESAPADEARCVFEKHVLPSVAGMAILLHLTPVWREFKAFITNGNEKHRVQAAFWEDVLTWQRDVRRAVAIQPASGAMDLHNRRMVRIKMETAATRLITKYLCRPPAGTTRDSRPMYIGYIAADRTGKCIDPEVAAETATIDVHIVRGDESPDTTQNGNESDDNNETGRYPPARLEADEDTVHLNLDGIVDKGGSVAPQETETKDATVNSNPTVTRRHISQRTGPPLPPSYGISDAWNLSDMHPSKQQRTTARLALTARITEFSRAMQRSEYAALNRASLFDTQFFFHPVLEALAVYWFTVCWGAFLEEGNKHGEMAIALETMLTQFLLIAPLEHTVEAVPSAH